MIDCAPWKAGSWQGEACMSDTAPWSSGSMCFLGYGALPPPDTPAPSAETDGCQGTDVSGGPEYHRPARHRLHLRKQQKATCQTTSHQSAPSMH